MIQSYFSFQEEYWKEKKWEKTYLYQPGTSTCVFSSSRGRAKTTSVGEFGDAEEGGGEAKLDPGRPNRKVTVVEEKFYTL